MFCSTIRSVPLFVMIGVLRPDVRSVSQDVQEQVNDFLGQLFVDIKSAGMLRDAAGRRAGMMVMVECNDRERAADFLAARKFLKEIAPQVSRVAFL